MRQRCNNPKHPRYADWGGRGITVCKRWDEFSNFLDDMGVAPVGMTLDREDNSKGYCKANCRWVTRTTQQQNTRKNRNITHCGETHCIREWARRLGMSPNTITARLLYGWTTYDTLTTPVQR